MWPHSVFDSPENEQKQNMEQLANCKLGSVWACQLLYKLYKKAKQPPDHVHILPLTNEENSTVCS